jgi:hypothetical protein
MLGATLGDSIGARHREASGKARLQWSWFPMTGVEARWVLVALQNCCFGEMVVDICLVYERVGEKDLV